MKVIKIIIFLLLIVGCKKVAYIICRAGIMIACHGVTEEKVCKQSYEELYACAL